jgi:iron(III) transport system permease protein
VRKGRFATVGGRGQQSNPMRLGKWKWFARTLPLFYVLLAVGVPIVGLILVALSPVWTPHLKWSAMNPQAFGAMFDDQTTRLALTNSVKLAIAGATIAMIIATVLTLDLQRRPNGFSRGIDAVIKIPAAVSAIVVTIAVILAFSGGPFNLSGTLAILLVCYLIQFLPQGSVAADAASSQVGKELMEASACSGARPARTFARVSVPLMVNGLVAGWALLFTRIISDLEASIMLSQTSNVTIGYRILDMFNEGQYPELAALTLVLTAVTTVVVSVALLFIRGRGNGASLMRLGR